MKIYHLVENLDDTYGGPAKSVPHLVKGLEDFKVNNTLLSVKYHNNESNEVIEKNNLEWRSFSYNFIKKSRYSKALKHYLINHIKKDQTLLHTHNLWNFISYIASKLSVKYKVPYVIAIRGALYPWSLSQSSLQKKIAWRLFQKQALQKATCIHVTDVAELNAVRELGITSPIALVPNGVNLDEFKSMKSKVDAKQELGLDSSKKNILFLSRIHPKKGIEFLITAWGKLVEKNPEWNLLIVGPNDDETYYQNLLKRIKKSNLEDRIIFKGMLTGEQRINSFAASDLYILPSHTENFGIAIAEAMAAKLPVITTKGTPWQEIIEYDAGWWVELSQQNIDTALSEALSCSDKELEKKGLNGFELVQKYEWKYQAKKMKEVYDWIFGIKEKPDFIHED
jgi:glycosyltransferase involved in cell wall biosynthesis